MWVSSFFREDGEGGRIFYNLFQMDGKKEVKKEDIFFVLTVLLKKHGSLYNSTHGLIHEKYSLLILLKLYFKLKHAKKMTDFPEEINETKVFKQILTIYR